MDWAIPRTKVVARWLGQRPWGLVGAGSDAGVRLA
jgi:hypothetical protein